MKTMTDRQFARLCNLLKKVEEKDIDISVRHRIAAKIQDSYNVDRTIDEYESLIEKNLLPMIQGEILKIKLISCDSLYGVLFSADDEPIQTITLNNRGKATVSCFGCSHNLLRKEKLALSEPYTKILFDKIMDYFSVCLTKTRAADTGGWELVVTNTKRKTFHFYGCLLPDDIELSELSDILRESLEHDDLLCFDGEREKGISIAFVTFGGGGKEYCYLLPNKEIEIGDRLEVPVGENGKTAVASVENVVCTKEYDSPYPIDKMKTIIRKVE